MSNKIELSASEMASLDFLIAKKQEDEMFITDVANDVAHIAEAVVATAAAVAAVAGNSNVTDNTLQGQLNIAKNTSLDELLALRNNAIVKR